MKMKALCYNFELIWLICKKRIRVLMEIYKEKMLSDMNTLRPEKTKRVRFPNTEFIEKLAEGYDKKLYREYIKRIMG